MENKTPLLVVVHHHPIYPANHTKQYKIQKKKTLPLLELMLQFRMDMQNNQIFKPTTTYHQQPVTMYVNSRDNDARRAVQGSQNVKTKEKGDQ